MRTIARHDADGRWTDGQRITPRRTAVQHDFGRAVHIECLHDVRPVRFDRTAADEEQCRDFLVRFAFGDELQDFPLSRREGVVWIGRTLLGQCLT